MVHQLDDDIQFLVVDLFCGAGGTTLGFEQARNTEVEQALESRFGKSFLKVCKVIGCVNHDPLAILSHTFNHANVEHYEEDITKLYGKILRGVLLKSPQLVHLQRLVSIYRAFYPNAKIILWSSLECTNFSNAKGGMSRSQDSRTLADHLFPYVIAINPDYIQIENVVEFKQWGPMIPKVITTKENFQACPIIYQYGKRQNKNGKRVTDKKQIDYVTPHWVPDPITKGQDWKRWCEQVDALGYRNEWKEMNAADYGALTARNRLFGCFAKPGLPIVWPAATHAKNPARHPGKNLKAWMPVKQALDFTDEGNSIFNRSKPLSPNTMERLYKGSIKHIAGGNTAYLSMYFSGSPESKSRSIYQPSATVTVVDHHALVNAKLHPASRSAFIDRQFSSGQQHQSIERPIGALPTVPKANYIQAKFFIDKQFSGEYNNQSIEAPAGTVLVNDKHALLRANHWLMNTNFKNVGHSLSVPSPVITADRHHHYLVNTNEIVQPSSQRIVVLEREHQMPLAYLFSEHSPIAIPFYEDECEWTYKLKEFMVLSGIVDITMRMLRIKELKKIQGFPDNYMLAGSQVHQKKFLGNAVHPHVPEHWILAMSNVLFPDYLNSLRNAA